MMSNKNKKDWINLIVPTVFVYIIFFAPVPDSLNNIVGGIIAIAVFISIQIYLNKFLNEKFPSYKDLKD